MGMQNGPQLKCPAHRLLAAWRSTCYRLRAKPLSAYPALQVLLNDDYTTAYPADCPLPPLTQARAVRIGTNWLIFADAIPASFPTRILSAAGSEGNILIFHGGAALPTHITLQGSHSRLIWGGGAPAHWRTDVSIRYCSNRQSLYWGDGSTSNGTSITLEGTARRVTIGRDCMFASGTAILTSDMHAIIDATTGKPLNPTADVHLGTHVWLGQDSCVSKGAVVGDGSIIGMKALVTGSIPAHSLAVGIPAKVMKQPVSWKRERPPA